MVKTLTYDLIKFSIIYIPSCIICFYSSIYPYIGSYMKHFNKDIKLTELFQYLPIIFLGVPMGNIMFEKFLFLFGFKKTMHLLSFLFLLYILLLFNFSSIFLYIITLLLQGFFYQIYTAAISFYFCFKYKNGSNVVSFTFGFKNFLNFVLPILALKMINPNNMETNNEDINDIYFEWSVSRNLPYFLCFYGFITFFLSIISVSMIEDLKIKPNWKLYFVFFFDKKKIKKLYDNHRIELENNISKDDFQENLLLENKNSSIMNEKNDIKKSFEENSQLDNLSEELIKEEISHLESDKIKRSPLFIGFFFNNFFKI